MKHYTLFYSLLNIAYYMLGNGIMGFEGYYLNKLGVSDSVIGIVLAATGIVTVLFQPLTGRLCDNGKRFDMRHAILVIVSGMILAAGISSLSKSRVLLAVLFCLLIVLFNQTNALLNSLCMLIENQGKKINYGLARGLGSVSYALTALANGYFSEEEHFGHSFLMWSIIATGIVSVFFVLPFLFDKSLSKNNPSIAKNYKRAGLLEFFKKYPRFVAFAFCLSLVFISHNILSTFVYQLISPMGRGSYEVGIIVGLAAFVELPGMVLCSVLLKKKSPATLLMISGFFFLLKTVFCLISVATGNFYVFFAAQFFQLAGYGFFAPASVYYANSVIAQDSLSSGQAIMTAANVFGCVLGSVIGGVFLDLLGSTGMMIITVGLCFLGCILICILLKEKKIPQK